MKQRKGRLFRSAFPPAAVLLLLLTTACILPGAAQQAGRRETFRLRQEAAYGDVSEVEARSTAQMQLRVAVGGEQVDLDYDHREDSKYSMEVLDADANGLAVSVRQKYILKREHWTDPDGIEHDRVSPVEGKTVDIKRLGLDVRITSPQGKLPKAVMDDLEGEVAHEPFLPDYEVAVGDEWNLPPMMVSRFFTGYEKASIRCRFEKVVDYAGQKCARLFLTLKASVKPAGSPGTMQQTLSGHLYHAIDLQRPLAMHLNGLVTLKGTIRRGREKIAVTGDGNVQMSVTTRWIKIAEKPVKRPG